MSATSSSSNIDFFMLGCVEVESRGKTVFSPAAPAAPTEHEECFMTAIAESLGEEAHGPIGLGIADAIDSKGELRYLEKLGEGGFGTVHRIHLDSFGEVALKILNLEMMEKEPKGVLIKDGRVGGEGLGLHFNGLPQVVNTLAVVILDPENQVFSLRNYDLLRDCENCRIVGVISEYVPGMDLEKCLRSRKRLNKRRVALEIAIALNAIHEWGGLFRDLKPANILIDEEGHAHLTDFGLARLVKTKTKRRRYTFSGSLATAAPEVCRQKKFNTQADVYSLGVTLFRMVFKYYAYGGLSIGSLYDAKDNGTVFADKAFQEFTLLTDLKEATGSRFKKMIYTMMDPDPEKRPTMDIVVSCLAKLQG